MCLCARQIAIKLRYVLEAVKNQAQYEYRFIVIEIVKLNVVERGTVSNSRREFERYCLCAEDMYTCRLEQKLY